MPSKRSKSKEREKKSIARLRMSEEAKANDLDKARARMEKSRDEKNEEEKESFKSNNRVAKRKSRLGITKAQAELIKIEKKHKMREKRKCRSGKEHLKQNLQAKKGMKIMESEGRIVEFSRRTGGNQDESRDWEIYSKNFKNFAKELGSKREDIVTMLNEKAREEKEKERVREERVKEDGGEWLYDGENEKYYWSGEGEPRMENDDFENETLTKEEVDKLRKEEEEENEAIIKIGKYVEKERRRLKEEERRESMNKPIDPLPEQEMCEYEKLREKNIKEREKAMFESGLFEDLNSYKKKMGLISNNDKKKFNLEKKVKMDSKKE